MPYKMRKVRGKDCYKVYNTVTKRVFAKCTTKEKATRQLAILREKVYNTEKNITSKTSKTSKKSKNITLKSNILKSNIKEK